MLQMEKHQFGHIMSMGKPLSIIQGLQGEEEKEEMIFFVLIFVLMAITAITIGAIILPTARKHERRCTGTAKGRVVAMNKYRPPSRHRGEVRSSYAQPIIEFTDQNGEIHQFPLKVVSNPPKYVPGDEVEVHYNPQYPEEAYIGKHSQYRLAAIIFIFVGVVFILFWALMFAITLAV